MKPWQEAEAYYGLRIHRVRQIRDNVQLDTQRGLLCLKPYHGTARELSFITAALHHLQKSGFHDAPQMLLGQGGDPILRVDGTPWLLTNWVIGRAPDFSKASELNQAIATLARFHRHAEGLHCEVPKRKRALSRWPTRIEHARATLLAGGRTQHKMSADRRRDRSDTLRSLLSLCDDADHLLRQPAAKVALAAEERRGAFTHGDYNYPNLVRDRRRHLQLIDFDNCAREARMADLAHILHRNRPWQAIDMIKLVERYDRVRPLSAGDRALLRIFLFYPYPVLRMIRQRRKLRSTASHPIPGEREVERYRIRLDRLL